MKMIHFSAAAAAMLVFPVLLSACLSDDSKAKTEPAVPQQEAPAASQAEEVKPEPVLDNSKPAPAPAAVEKKSEPAPAPAAVEKKSEPAPAPAAVEKKSEPAPAAEKKKADKSIQPPVEHVVKTGDSLWSISRKYYGSGAQWKRIYEANKAAVKKQDFLEPGTVLVIPAAK